MAFKHVLQNGFLNLIYALTVMNAATQTGGLLGEMPRAPLLHEANMKALRFFTTT